jgi:hypothetical protein
LVSPEIWDEVFQNMNEGPIEEDIRKRMVKEYKETLTKGRTHDEVVAWLSMIEPRDPVVKTAMIRDLKLNANCSLGDLANEYKKTKFSVMNLMTFFKIYLSLFTSYSQEIVSSLAKRDAMNALFYDPLEKFSEEMKVPDKDSVLQIAKYIREE